MPVLVLAILYVPRRERVRLLAPVEEFGSKWAHYPKDTLTVLQSSDLAGAELAKFSLEGFVLTIRRWYHAVHRKLRVEARSYRG